MKRKVFDGHRLRVKMAEADIKPGQLAEKVRVPAQYVSEWRRGMEPKDMEKVADIAKALGCTVGDLYSEVKA